MSVTDDAILEAVLAREGGFTFRPEDAGGATNWGITAAVLAAARHVTAVTIDEVRRLTREEAKRIYLKRYVEDPGFTSIANAALRGLAVDCAVQHGPGVAIRWLQASLGLAVDGASGPVTRAALAAIPNPRGLYLTLCAVRTRYYGRLLTRVPSQSVFAAGWCDRVADFIEAAP